jgi:hypothetical protein
MNLHQMRNRGESARDELTKTYVLLRDMLADRLDDMDREALAKRGYKAAADIRHKVESRVRPRPRRRLPVAGLVLLAGAVGIWVLLYDRRRRDMVRGRITQVRVRGREKLVELGGVSGAVDNVMGKVRSGAGPADEARLHTDVHTAVTAGGALPVGLKITVEGRTVYLRGVVDNPAFVDQAAERAQNVNGVAAVVNLTSGPEPAPLPQPKRKA